MITFTLHYVALSGSVCGAADNQSTCEERVLHSSDGPHVAGSVVTGKHIRSTATLSQIA